MFLSHYRPSFQRADPISVRRAHSAGGAPPREFSWIRIDAKSASAWQAAHGRKIGPGKYSSPSFNQHTSGWCGACFLVATVQVVQDAYSIRDGGGIPEDVKDRRVYEFDIQDALDRFSGIHAATIYAKENVGVTLARPTTWNACMGGDPTDVLVALKGGSLALHLLRGSSRWKARATPNSGVPLPRNYAIRDFAVIEPNQEAVLRAVFRGPIIAAVRSAPLWHIHEGIAPCGEGERDHVVAIVGWELRGERRYWIVRNSWGKEIWTRPDDVRRCKQNSSQPECQSAKVAWNTDYGENGHFIIDASDDANCLGLYDAPSGLLEVIV